MNKNILKISLLALCISTFSCSGNVPNIQTNQNTKISSQKLSHVQIKGIVQFPGDNFKTKYFRIKDNLTEISTASTISIIRTSDNKSIASGLTDNLGAFTINIDDITFQTGDIFVMEASKRINNTNISIRTLIKWDGNNWQSITSNGIYINDKTTAIALISNLNPSGLPASLAINSYDNVTVQDIGGLSKDIIIKVTNRVNLLIKKGKDPASQIKFVSNDYLADSKIDFSELILFGVCNYCSLEKTNFINNQIKYSDLSHSNLENSNLSNSKFIGGYFTETNLKNSTLNYIDISSADLSNADFSNAQINNANLIGSYLSNTNFKDAIVKSSTLNYIRIKSSNFSGANLNGSNLSSSQIEDTDFAGSYLQINNSENVNLSGSYLSNINFTNSHMNNANFINSTLDRINLTGADLSNVDLSNSSLSDVTISNTNLTGANLDGADLEQIDMSGAILTGATLNGATWTNGQICKTGSIGRCVLD